MESFVKGDIIVISFPFTDLSTTKLRPAFVIKEKDDYNCIICPITSSMKRAKYGFKLSKNNFQEGDLKKDESYIMYDHITTLEKSLIKYKIGNLKTDITSKIVKKSYLF